MCVCVYQYLVVVHYILVSVVLTVVLVMYVLGVFRAALFNAASFDPRRVAPRDTAAAAQYTLFGCAFRFCQNLDPSDCNLCSENGRLR